jgi:hypothetical protein
VAKSYMRVIVSLLTLITVFTMTLTARAACTPSATANCYTALHGSSSTNAGVIGTASSSAVGVYGSNGGTAQTGPWGVCIHP